MRTHDIYKRLALAIRPAQVSDAAEVVRIECESFPDPWSENDVRRALTGAQAGGLVAYTDNGQVAGYCFYWVVADEAEIHSLGVSPLWRRRGVARSILERLFADCIARGVARVLLEVRYTNAAAIALYHGLGFQLTQSGRGIILMVRMLC